MQASNEYVLIQLRQHYPSRIFIFKDMKNLENIVNDAHTGCHLNESINEGSSQENQQEIVKCGSYQSGNLMELSNHKYLIHILNILTKTKLNIFYTRQKGLHLYRCNIAKWKLQIKNRYQQIVSDIL